MWEYTPPPPALWLPQPAGRLGQESVMGCRGFPWQERTCYSWWRQTHKQKDSWSRNSTAQLWGACKVKVALSYPPSPNRLGVVSTLWTFCKERYVTAVRPSAGSSNTPALCAVRMKQTRVIVGPRQLLVLPPSPRCVFQTGFYADGFVHTPASDWFLHLASFHHHWLHRWIWADQVRTESVLETSTYSQVSWDRCWWSLYSSWFMAVAHSHHWGQTDSTRLFPVTRFKDQSCKSQSCRCSLHIICHTPRKETFKPLVKLCNSYVQLYAFSYFNNSTGSLK